MTGIHARPISGVHSTPPAQNGNAGHNSKSDYRHPIAQRRSRYLLRAPTLQLAESRLVWLKLGATERRTAGDGVYEKVVRQRKLLDAVEVILEMVFEQMFQQTRRNRGA